MIWLAIVVVGLLVINQFAFPERVIRPTVANVKDTGLARFYTWMRKIGYDVHVNPYNTDLPRDAVVIRFKIDLPVEDDFPVMEEQTYTNRMRELYGFSLARHLEQGGRGILFRLPILEANYKAIDPPVAVLVTERRTTMNINLGGNSATFRNIVGMNGYASLEQVGDGILADVRDGTPALNRYLARGDNAELLARMLKVLVPKGAMVIIDESDGGAPGFLEALGPWAISAANQFWIGFFLFAAFASIGVGHVYGKRAPQPGITSIHGALTALMLRNRNQTLLAKTVAQMTIRDVNRYLRLPSSTKPGEWPTRVPPGLINAVARLQILGESQQAKANEVEALIKDIYIRWNALKNTDAAGPTEK
jgi:hypothetical protein